MTRTEFLDKCLEIPYKDKGMNFKGLDCYGFVYCYFKYCFNIALPLNVFTSDDIRPYVSKIDKPDENGCIVQLNACFGDSTEHVGIYQKGYVYHFNYDGLQVKRADKFKHLIKGYYSVIKD